MENDKQITTIIQQNNLEITQAEKMLLPLAKFLQEAKGWEEKARAIVVTDIGQVEQMAAARTARLALKKIRVSAEDTRKDLKEKSLREGRAIDGVANIIKAVIVPIEEHLEKQEKFAEEQEKAKKQKIYDERVAIINVYGADPTLYNLKEMSVESFATLADSLKAAAEGKKALDEKSERERLEREKAKEDEDKKIREENTRLKKEQDDKEQIRLKEKAESDRKLKDAEDARLKLEKEKADREKKEADEKKAKQEAQRKAKAAPDKVKLKELASRIRNTELPEVTSDEAKLTVDDFKHRLDELAHELEQALSKI